MPKTDSVDCPWCELAGMDPAEWLVHWCEIHAFTDLDEAGSGHNCPACLADLNGDHLTTVDLADHFGPLTVACGTSGSSIADVAEKISEKIYSALYTRLWFGGIDQEIDDPGCDVNAILATIRDETGFDREGVGFRMARKSPDLGWLGGWIMGHGNSTRWIDGNHRDSLIDVNA